MAAPIRNSIELEAVRELHFVLFIEPTALLGPFELIAALAIFLRFLLILIGSRVLDKFEFVEGAAGRSGCVPPSPVLGVWRFLSACRLARGGATRFN